MCSFSRVVEYGAILFFAITLMVSVTEGGAIDEVNLFRTTHGLRAFKHDPQPTAFAQRKAEYRAARMLKNGHQGPQNPPGTTEGTAEATAMWGWLSCSMEEDWKYAGAGVAIGGDGERYMVLVVREGSGVALRGRNLRPVPTAHLTPNPPRFDRSGHRLASKAPIRPTTAKPLRNRKSSGKPKPAHGLNASPSAPLRVGQRDRDGALIIRVLNSY